MTRVAIVHDYLTQRGGAERVVLSMHHAFPDAVLHTSMLDPAGTFPELAALDVRTTWLNRVPGLTRHHRAALPLFAPTFGRWHIDADVVVCSSSAWAHGVRSSGRVLVYCYTPARWLWGDDPVATGAQATIGRAALAVVGPSLRRWDRRAARRADRFLTSSSVVAERIHRAYGIEAAVLAPPVTIDPGAAQRPFADLEPGYGLCVARLLPYKHVDAVVEAFRRLADERLVVVGAGPAAPEIAAAAAASRGRVRWYKTVDDASLRWLYANASVLVSAAHEDFGLTPLEANAFGLPVVAPRAGGFVETVVDGTTGVLVEGIEPDALADGVREVGRRAWDRAAILGHARRYDETAFIDRLRLEVARLA